MKDLDQALFTAAREGQPDEVRRLIGAGADPNSIDPTDLGNGMFLINLTPLMVAAGSPRSNVETVRVLLELGANPLCRSLGGTTALWYAAGGLGFSLETTDWKLEEGHPYLNWGGGDAERLQLLLDAGGDPNDTASNGRSALNESAAAGDPERLKMLIERGAAVTSSRLNNYCVPLFSAANSGNLECVRLILDNGFPADYNNNGNALDHARTAEIAELLWGRAVRPVENWGFFDSVGTLFENDRYEAASFILSKVPRSQEGYNYLNGALCTASGVQMNPKAVQILLDLGADVNAECGYMGTALHSACWQGDGDSGRETDIVRETLELLIAAGARVDKNLPDHGTPLHQAVSGDWGSPTSAAVLIQHGAPVDAVDSSGQTSLMRACGVGEVECVRLLLAAHADRSIRDHDGRAAMDYALEHLDVWRSIVADPPRTRRIIEDPAAARAREQAALDCAEAVVRLLST